MNNKEPVARYEISYGCAGFFVFSCADSCGEPHQKKGVKNDGSGNGLFGRPYRWHHRGSRGTF